MCSTIPSSDFTPSAAGLTEENDVSVCLSRIDGNYIESLLVQSYPGLIIGEHYWHFRCRNYYIYHTFDILSESIMHCESKKV